MIYIAYVYKDGDSDYGVVFPDFPGCIAAATSLKQVILEARAALVGHIRLMKEMGETIPAPSRFPKGAALALGILDIDVGDTL